jgi:alpha-N-arabinofuranosidase
LDATAKRDPAGRALVLQVVNLRDQPITAAIRIDGFTASQPIAEVTELTGPLDAVNSAARPDAIIPKRSEWKHELRDGQAKRTIAPRSFTIIRWQ